MSEDTSDSEIIDTVLSGTLESFAELIERHKKFVTMRIAWRVPGTAVQDLVQETFIEAYRSLPSFRKESSFKTWIARIAARRVYRYWNSKQRKLASLESFLPESNRTLASTMQSRSEEAFNEDELRKEIRTIISKALGELSYKDRMIICLLYFQGCSIQQVSDELGMSKINIKVRSHRAKKHMKQYLYSIGVDWEAFQ